MMRELLSFLMLAFDRRGPEFEELLTLAQTTDCLLQQSAILFEFCQPGFLRNRDVNQELDGFFNTHSFSNFNKAKAAVPSWMPHFFARALNHLEI